MKSNPDCSSPRAWILDRFRRLKTAREKGGLSAKMARGQGKGCPFNDDELDAALRELRNEGTLTYTGGAVNKWWMR